MVRITKTITWLKPFALTLLLLFCATTGQADDTEIYYQNSTGGGNVNLLFMFDTSGSMAWCQNSNETPSSSDPNCPADGSKVRINIMKKVFSQLIDGMGGNINVGIGAFSGSGIAPLGGGQTGNGGYILYPVRGLDKPAANLVADSIIKYGQDDGFEQTGSSTAATWNTAGLYLPSNNAASTGTGLLFRNLQVPSYATITSATLTVSAVANTSVPLSMNGYYSLGANLPNLAAQDLNSRTWGPMVVTPPATSPTLQGVPVSVSGSWTSGTSYGIDVTNLVQAAVNDSSWCGSSDMLLGFINANPADTSARQIGSMETVLDNGQGYPPASLHIQWALNPSLPPAAKSCNGGMNSSMGDSADDAQQNTSGSVATNGNTITLQSGYYGGFRFPGIKYAPTDTVISAILHLPGKGSQEQSTTKQCWAYTSSRWGGTNWQFAVATDGSISDPQNASFAGGANCGGTYYQCYSRCGTNRAKYDTYTTDWRNYTGTGPIPTGQNVTLHVSVVQGNASAITSTNNNISGRTVLASQDFTIPADSTSWNTNMDLDVTALAQQAMSAANGWAANSALMFVISATTLPDPSAQFFLNTTDGGQGASLTFTIGSPNQTEFIQLVRDQLKAAVNGLSPNGGTPLTESYTEMAAYMMGDDTYFGDGNDPYATSNPTSTVNQKGVTYDSPIAPANQSCAANSIVVMTDGVSNSDNEAPTRLNAVSGQTCKLDTGYDSSTINPSDYACMAKLSGWLNNSTQNTVKRQVTTNQVGFYLSNAALTAMKTVSDAGSGVTLAANDAASLLQSFQTIVNSVVNTNATMTAPGVAVNQLNRLQYLNQLYYAVFKPKNISVWPGNLKKYALGGTVQSPVILDAKGSPAVDPSTGFFINTARSYWSNGVDGKEVAKGGADSVLGADNANAASGNARNLFVTTAAGAPTSTNATSSTLDETGGGAAGAGVGGSGLTQVTAYNTLPATAYGLPSTATAAQEQTLFNWVMNAWGDPLHSEPQLVNYGYKGGSNTAAAADPALQNNVVFVSDNDGILHAVDANAGHELFAFSPIEELNKDTIRQSTETTGSPLLDSTTHHRTTYGLDGTWTFWRRANPSDPSTVKAVYAYGGQRRGGNNYYALDVTNMDFKGTNNSYPMLMWQLSPTSGPAPFSIMGQTWSQPQLAKVRINGADVPVLIFGGGYDPSEDSTDSTTPPTVNAKDNMGNAIYMVNAYTGALIWYASSAQVGSSSTNYGVSTDPDMKWSIPAAPAVVDVDGDGYADFIYVGDMHGQIFRATLNKNNTGVGNLVHDVTTLAQLGASSTSDYANNRRFYNSPTVAMGERNGVKILQVVIGSGYRAHPLSATTKDWVYGIDDAAALPTLQALNGGNTVVATQPNMTQPIQASNLVDVSTLASNATVNIDDGGAGLNIFGWALGLDQSVGEKSLSEAAIMQNVAIFTTFINKSTQMDSCTSVAGGARLYAVDLGTGLAKPNFFASGTTTIDEGRATSVNVPGIPPKPQVLLTNLPNAPGTPPPTNVSPLCGLLATSLTGIVGTSAIGLGTINQCGLQRTGWYQTTPTELQDLFNAQGAK